MTATKFQVKMPEKSTGYCFVCFAIFKEIVAGIDRLNRDKCSFLKEGLPSWKQHVHLVCWEHLQIWLLFTLH